MTYGNQPEDWKLQASIKVGRHSEHMLNVRAVTIDELVSLLDRLSGTSSLVNHSINTIAEFVDGNPVPNTEQAIANIQQQFPQTQQFQPGVITPQTQPPTYGPPPAAPFCVHGEMKKYSGISKTTGEPYTAYFCAGPKGPNQCKAKFLD